MSAFTLSFVFSFIATLLVVRYSHLHEHLTADYDLVGVQKFHASPVPRIGGLSLLIGLLVALVFWYIEYREVGTFGLLMFLSALPAFGLGFLEDLTKRVGVKIRLLATALSAALAGYLLGAWLSSLQILGIDNLMTYSPVVAIAVTCFAVAGVANAFNIIDGYNGLSGMVGVIILSGIAYVAFQVNDTEIMVAAFAMIGAISGFLLWNYPRGLIFLGDGGAYLIGFWIAELSVLLTARHDEVSKWFPLLLCAYPIFETLFTIYRRIVIHRSHPGMPDATHLHQLIYMRIVRWYVRCDDTSLNWQRNALTSLYLWVLTVFSAIPAVFFWDNHTILKIFTIFFAAIYIYIYRSIVLFKIPDWICIRHDR